MTIFRFTRGISSFGLEFSSRDWKKLDPPPFDDRRQGAFLCWTPTSGRASLASSNCVRNEGRQNDCCWESFAFMLRMLKIVAKFAIVSFVMTIVCTVAWQTIVVEYLYDCTDDNIAGFLRPGDWVHFYHGVVYVPHVVHNHSMSDPDSIRQGWSITGLWCLWWSFAVVSLVISVLLARRIWIPNAHTQPKTSLR